MLGLGFNLPDWYWFRGFALRTILFVGLGAATQSALLAVIIAVPTAVLTLVLVYSLEAVPWYVW